MKHPVVFRCRCLLLLVVALPPAIRAQVATDGSFGKPAGQLPGPAFAVPDSLGKKVGGNLFHSFSEFSLNQTQSATFTGPAEVKNILARVTGGNISTIDGMLKSDIAGANFFLLNPKGVLFGPNASVDVSGSFAVSTGDRITLADGAHFKARASDPSDALLTSAAPAAFGFLGKGAGPITVDGSFLQAPPDLKTGLPRPGNWTLAGGDIRMTNATVAAQGSVVIRGGRLAMSSSTVLVFAQKPADRVSVKLRGALTLGDASVVVGLALADLGRTDLIRLSAASASIKGAGTAVFASAQGDGSGGDVRLDLNGRLSVRRGATVRAETNGQGRGGNILVNAGEVDVVGRSLFDTTISANANENSTGRAGNVTLNIARSLLVSAGGQVRSDTFGAGSGGNVRIAAGSVRVDGAGLNAFTGISAETQDVAFGGPGGNVRLDIRGPVALAGGGQITTTSFGIGDGGNIDLSAASLTISGKDAIFVPGIVANSRNATFGGRAGAIGLHISGRLEIVDGGQISVSTAGPGAGGNIAIQAGDLALSGQGTSISAQTMSAFGGGTGGSISLTADSLTARDGAEISASTAGSGAGGSIEVAARRIEIERASITADTVAERLVLKPQAISDLRVTIELDQAIDANLTLQLRSPDQTTIVLAAGVGADGQNFTGTIFADDAPFAINDPKHAQAPFTGEFRPLMQLSTFDQRPLDGTWHLVLTDDFSELLMTRLKSWSLSSGGVTFSSGNIDVTLPGPSGTRNVLADLVIAAPPSELVAIRPGKGGDVRIHGDLLRVSDAARISARTLGAGAGGNIEFSAANLSLSTRGAISAESTGAGRGGSVSGTVPGTLQITNSGLITASTLLSGAGGNINLDAGNLAISTRGEVSAATLGSGRGGGVRIAAGNLILSADARISAATSGSGAGGNIEFFAANLGLSTGGAISAQSAGSGRGGGIRGVIPGTLQITDSGIITASTLFSGRGGNVRLDAGDLFISTGGKISAATAGTGKGGTIDVTAKSIVISKGNSTGAALISAESTSTGKGGSGGDVSIDAGSLRIDGAPDFQTGISASSFGRGDSGTIRLGLGTLSLDSSAFIGSSNTGDGNAGSVVVRAGGDIFVRGGSVISTAATQADAGDIDVASLTRIDLREGASITASAGRNGGSITVAAPDFIHLIDSNITAKAGAEKLANAEGGRGGNITIDPEFMVLDHSFIKADAAIGQGGNILLQTDNFLSSETSITATGTTAGTVEIVAPELDLSAALAILRGGLVDPSTQLREQCARRLGLDFSSFLVIGRGGVSLAPDDPLTDAGPARKRQPAR